MVITKREERYKGTAISIAGHTVSIITDATPRPAFNSFVELCRKNEAELLRLLIAADKARKWNYAHSGKGKDWPAFKSLERMVNKLLKEANVKDS